MTPNTITVAGHEFGRKAFVFACVFVGIERLKAQGLVECKWTADIDTMQQLKDAGEAAGWPLPSKPEIFAALNAMERKARQLSAELN